MKTVYSGFNYTFEPKKKERSVSDANKFKIIAVGRPHWIKGYYYALDAMKKLKDKNFSFSFTIVGGSNLELQYQIDELELGDHVTIQDRLPFEQVQTLIHDSDLLFLSSLEEGIANVVLEAMAAKTLVLSTNCGGMSEVIEDGVNGFLVPVRNPGKMAMKIMEIQNLSDLDQENIKEKAYKTIVEQHSEKDMINGMLELYQSL